MYRAPVRTALPRKISRQIPVTWTYLGEDETGYYFLEGFFDNIGNMFKRMVKFTPKSFTPGNIYKGFVNTALTTMTGGIYQVLPKNIKQTVYNVGKVAIPVVAGGVLAYTAGPAIWGVIGPKITAAAGMLGKVATTVGGQLFSVLNRLPQAQQAQVAQQLTPQQIAQIEQGYISPEVQAMMNQAAQAAYYPPAPPMSMEQAYGPQPGMEPTQAGMMGGGDNTILIFIGLSAVGLVIFGLPGKARR